MDATSRGIVGRYTGIAILLHWLIAALIVANVLLAWSFAYWADDAVRPVIDLHKSIGITVLGLAVLRILWRLTHTPPPIPSGYAGWERRSAHAAHWALYVVMFALPLTGWLHDSAWIDANSHPMKLYGLVPWPRIGLIQGFPPAEQNHLHDQLGAAHVWAGYLLYFLLALHVLGALKHQFLDREPEFQRMAP